MASREQAGGEKYRRQREADIPRKALAAGLWLQRRRQGGEAPRARVRWPRETVGCGGVRRRSRKLTQSMKQTDGAEFLKSERRPRRVCGCEVREAMRRT